MDQIHKYDKNYCNAVQYIDKNKYVTSNFMKQSDLSDSDSE